MPFAINDQIIDLQTIKMPDGSYYFGNDETRALLSGAWQELDRRFWNKGEPVVFKTPGIKSGAGKGNQGYSYPRAVSHKTKRGKVTVVWYEDIKEEGGKKVYTPVCGKVGVNDKTITLQPEDIEKALFMFLFNPMVMKPGRMTGKTYLEDKEEDAKKYAEAETNSAVISYWLYREESPFYLDKSKLDTLALAWGVNPANKSIPYVKQLLAEAVKTCERRNDIEFNLKAFDSACEKLKGGEDVVNIEVLALIQKCISAKTIWFSQQEFKWQLLGIDQRTPIKTICKVPPQSINQARNILRSHLINNREDYQILESAVMGDMAPSKNDRVLLSVSLPDVIDENFIRNELSWPDRKALYAYFGFDPKGAKDEVIVPVLCEKLILNNVKVPFAIKPTK